MAVIASDKYHLKSIHEEISLFDRKLAHLKNFETFASDEDRELAVRKLTTKRETLVTTARRLAAEGIEFKPSELPRSLRPEGSEEIASVAEPIAEEKPMAEPLATQPSRDARRHSTPYAGTSLDWQASVLQYMKKKNKA